MSAVDRQWLPAMPLFAAGSAGASPAIEGDLANHTAMVLVSLGLIAIGVGIRNLHELRHKRLRRRDSAMTTATDAAGEVENDLPY